MLIEGPLQPEQLKLLAQHIIAKGLERVPTLQNEVSLRFRLVSLVLPEPDAGEREEGVLMDHLDHALNHLVTEPRKVVMHLPLRRPAAA